MPNKYLFKLSAISVALLGFASSTYAQQCEAPVSVSDSLGFSLSSCKLSANVNDITSSLFSAQNSVVLLENVNFEVFGEHSSVASTIRLSDSDVVIRDSQLSHNNDENSESSAGLARLQGETNVTFINTKLAATGETSAFEVLDSSSPYLSSITLNNATVTSQDDILGIAWGGFSKRYANVELNVKESNLTAPYIISPSSLAELYQIYGTDGTETITLSAKNSTLNGSLAIDEADLDRSTINVSLTDSSWEMPLHQESAGLFNNGATNVKLQNSQVILQNEQGFQTFTIYGNLSGNGHFDLNTDLANEKSDKIVVKGEDSGNFTLGIKDSGNEPNAANGKVTLVETRTGQAQFSLKDKDYVDAGAYRYRLSQDGTNWILSNRAGETNTQPEPVSEPEPPVEQPAVETPVAETVEQPVVETPVAETVEQPAVETPAAETVEQPVVEAPAAETVEQPAIETPAAETVEQPAVETLVPIVVAPVIPAVVETITNDKPSEQPAMAVLSEKSNALVSLRQAQGLLISQNLQGIHQRLGELKTDKTSHIWVKNINGRTNAKAQNVAVDSRSSGFEMDYHNLQIGADRAVSENTRLGGFVGTSRADVDFNGEYGKAKLRSQAVGFYATFANNNGWYVDNVGKYERLTSQAVGEKHKYNAFSLSNEIGKRIAFANDWTVTPQAQIAYHTISGRSDENRFSLFTARAGVRVTKGFAVANGWSLLPYVELNGIVEKANNAKIRVNQYHFDVPENRGRFQTAIGISAGNSNHRLGLEASTTQGKQVKQPISALANYRYQW